MVEAFKAINCMAFNHLFQNESKKEGVENVLFLLNIKEIEKLFLIKKSFKKQSFSFVIDFLKNVPKNNQETNEKKNNHSKDLKSFQKIQGQKRRFLKTNDINQAFYLFLDENLLILEECNHFDVFDSAKGNKIGVEFLTSNFMMISFKILKEIKILVTIFSYSFKGY